MNPDVQFSDQADQVRLQNEFLFGKLGHLAGVGTFQASGSLRPLAVVKLERWMKANDTLQSEQPELDDILRELGIGHRLVRKADGTSYWKAIPPVRPLCEIVTSRDGLPQAPATVQAEWEGSSCLRITLTLTAESTLLVRQYNDGGWWISCPTTPQITILDNQLFVVFVVPPGEHTMRLNRRW